LRHVNYKILGSFIFAAWIFVGCVTTSTSEQPLPPHVPTSPLGVRLSRTGEAVVELNLAQDIVCDACEAFLRKKMQVTFANRPKEVDAENRTTQYFVTFSSLTTGKTALSVFAQKKEKTVDYQAAQDLANELVLELKGVSKPVGIPFRNQSISPRDDIPPATRQ
jgi:hypothetical protein